MPERRLRLQFPGPDTSGFRSDMWEREDRFPQPAYGALDVNGHDYPTVNVHQSGTLSSMTRSVQFHDNTSYTLPNANGCSAYGTNHFWTARTKTSSGGSNSTSYNVKHNYGKGANWIYGHKGPASNDSVIQSFTRGPIGFSWAWQTGSSSSRGLKLKNLIMLYRKKEWTDRFFGVWLAKNGSVATGVTRNKCTNGMSFSAQDCFGSWSSNGTWKGLNNFVCNEGSGAANAVRTQNMCFQSIWFEFETMDTGNPSQLEVQYHMWACRLLYDNTPTGYPNVGSERIVLPQHWRFDSAFDRSKPLKLTSYYNDGG